MDINSFNRFSLSLFLVLLITGCLHLFILHQFDLPLFGNRIIAAYLINYALALLIYLVLFLLKHKMSEQLGFLYMGGSFLKFLVFFVYFYPYYKFDGGLDSIEFAAFFTPYVICLFFETFGVIGFLKK